jgi:hypothetical protein
LALGAPKRGETTNELLREVTVNEHNPINTLCRLPMVESIKGRQIRALRVDSMMTPPDVVMAAWMMLMKCRQRKKWKTRPERTDGEQTLVNYGSLIFIHHNNG